MKRIMTRTLGAAALAMLPLVAGCGEGAQDITTIHATKDESTSTLSAVLTADGQMGTLRDAFAKGGLASLFEEPGSYTLLAPTDDAFAKLGDVETDLLSDEQRPLLVGVLRNHLLPGHITPEAIAEAIKAKGGPVTMTTLGGGKLTFTQDGEQLSATLADGTSANIAGTSVSTSNGVLIPLDAVLAPKS